MRSSVAQAMKAYGGPQAIINSTDTVMFVTAVAHARGGFVLSANGLYVPEDGLYTVGAVIAWQANATGIRTAKIHVNGGEPLAGLQQLPAGAASAYTVNHLSTQIRLRRGDRLTVVGNQTSGVAINADQTHMSAVKE